MARQHPVRPERAMALLQERGKHQHSVHEVDIAAACLWTMLSVTASQASGRFPRVVRAVAEHVMRLAYLLG